MGRLSVKVPVDFEDRFRKEVGKRYGAKKGNIERAMVEAIELWMKQAQAKKQS